MSNTSITLASEGQSLAQMMGLQDKPNGSRSMLPRFSQIHNPVKHEIEVNGKKIKADAIPAGAYKLVQSDDTVMYSVNPKIRIFAQRQQWTRWDSDKQVMIKTVLSNTLNGDLKDNVGGFNAGRPSGFIKDFKSLPQATQELMRNTKLTKVVFGVVIMTEAMDEQGNPIGAAEEAIPFVMDVKSRGSIKAIDEAIKVVARKNALPVDYYLELDSEQHSMPSGNEYSTMVLALDNKVDVSAQDKEYLTNFMEWITGMNNYIVSEHDKNNEMSLGADALDAINEIINIEVAE